LNKGDWIGGAANGEPQVRRMPTIIFNKMLGLNAIYSENINFLNAPDKKLFRHKHWKCS
jgi:hypothetical protein